MKKSLLFSGLAIVGTVLTAVLANSAGKKISKIDSPTKKDLVRTYAPTVLTGGATIACIIFSYRLSAKQIAALTSMGAAGTKKFNAYRKEIRDRYGQDVDQDIMAQIATQDWQITPALPESDNKELELFYESYTETPFYASSERVQQAMYHLNRNFQLKGGVIFINEFYDFLGINAKANPYAGWYAGDMMDGGLTPWIDFYIADKVINGKKMKVIGYDYEPWIVDEDYR